MLPGYHFMHLEMDYSTGNLLKEAIEQLFLEIISEQQGAW